MSRIEWRRAAETKPIGGLAAWLAALVTQRRRPRHRLELLERIALAPRQSLALIEAEGRLLLVATSPEGSPAFYDLDGSGNLDAIKNLDAVKNLHAAGNPDGLPDRGASAPSGTGPRKPRRVSW